MFPMCGVMGGDEWCIFNQSHFPVVYWWTKSVVLQVVMLSIYSTKC